MRSHPSIIADRMIRAALRSVCVYKISAVGIDRKGRIIGIAVNQPRLPSRGLHAEELLIRRSPRSLAKIIIARVGATGILRPIDPCEKCQKLANKYGIMIESLSLKG